MVAQSKNNVSASVLPDLSDDSEVEAPEKKEPVVVVAEPVETPTSVELVALDSTPAPTAASKTLTDMVVTETIEVPNADKEPVVIEKPSPLPPVVPITEAVVAEDLNTPAEVENIEEPKIDKEPSPSPDPAPVSESVPTSTISASVVPELSPVEPVEVSQVSPAETKTPPVESSQTEDREEIPLEKKNAKLYKIGTVLLVLILISTIGVFYMRTKTTTVATKVEEAISTPTPESTPEPTPEIIVLERDEITLEILNGTSTSGLAGKTADIFEELGYKIGDVGNADDASKSQLYVKTEFADQLDNLLEDVKDELDIAEVTKEVDDLDVTAKIILGGE